MLRNTCRDFADSVLKPSAAETDRLHRFPADAVRLFKSFMHLIGAGEADGRAWVDGHRCTSGGGRHGFHQPGIRHRHGGNQSWMCVCRCHYVGQQRTSVSEVHV